MACLLGVHVFDVVKERVCEDEFSGGDADLHDASGELTSFWIREFILEWNDGSEVEEIVIFIHPNSWVNASSRRVSRFVSFSDRDFFLLRIFLSWLSSLFRSVRSLTLRIL